MKTKLIIVFAYLLSSQVLGQEKRVVSKIDSTNSPELVLIQELSVKAPIDSVWKAYTTKEGWENWAVPLAEIDLKVGGFIKTNYIESGDTTTIKMNIVNYVPKRLLTLQAEITEHFPEFMKDDAKDFYNVIYFDEAENGDTHIKSYGIGYKNNPKYLALLNYFIPANEQTLMNLIEYLE